MKNAELKKLIRQAADETPVPDCADRILTTVRHTPTAVRSDEPVRERTVARPQRRVWIPALSVALAACLVIALIPWAKLFTPTAPLAVGKVQQVMSREVLALGGAIVQDGQQRLLAKGQEDLTQEECDEIARSVNEYLFAGDAFCDKDNIKTRYEQNKDTAYKDWAYKLTVTYKDTNGYTMTYFAYYDETKRTAREVEVRGVLVVDGMPYDFSGEREEEHDEVEMELRLVTGQNSYVTVSNETEVNENEYEYNYYENGRLVTSVEMEVSSERGVKRSELEITKNNVTREFECTYTATGAEIKCYDEREDFVASASVTADGAYYVYTFTGGNVVRLLK